MTSKAIRGIACLCYIILFGGTSRYKLSQCTEAISVINPYLLCWISSVRKKPWAITHNNRNWLIIGQVLQICSIRLNYTTILDGHICRDIKELWYSILICLLKIRKKWSVCFVNRRLTILQNIICFVIRWCNNLVSCLQRITFYFHFLS